MKNFEFIRYEIKNNTPWITFIRPDCFNAMNKKMKGEIVEAIELANKDSSSPCLVITGEGKAFSAGQDLNDRTVQAETGPVNLEETLKTEWNPLVNAIHDSKKLVIAVINGVCAGAGLSVALSCDLIVSKPKVKFVSGFAQIGLAPDAGSSHLLYHHLGYQRALEFFLMGEPLYAEDLQKFGLLNTITDNLEEDVNALTEKLNAMAPLALQKIKENLQFARDNDRANSIGRETKTQGFLGASLDYAEGTKAFFEKRRPNFKGQ